MFTKKIVDSDAFLEMPQSSQLLYFHLSMRADDDGFINNPKRISKMLGCGDDDLKILLIKKFILDFESGVIVIKHWRLHNSIRIDRYHETEYLDEKKQLVVKDNGVYTTKNKVEVIDWQPNGNQLQPEYSLGKDSIGKIKNTLCQDVIEYLNLKSQSKFTTSKAHCSHINARAEEGHTLDDFKKVIDNMCDKWLTDKDMSQYLRPSTLFGTKFEGYLNAEPKNKKEERPSKSWGVTI